MGRLASVVRYAVLVVAAVVFVFPFYQIIAGSVAEDFVGSVWPTALTLDNWRYVLDQIPLGWSILNSAVYTFGVVTATVVVGSLTGYALARLTFRGRDFLHGIILVTIMMPFQLLMIPLYIMVTQWGWTGTGPRTYLGLILPGAVYPIAIIVFRQFFRKIPGELLDAARMDGCGELRTLWHVVLPLSRPAFVIVVLITFIHPWNEFIWPLLVVKDPAWMPLAESVGIFGISNQATSATSFWGTVTASASTLAVPAIVLFLFFQRHFMAGSLSSGLKE